MMVRGITLNKFNKTYNLLAFAILIFSAVSFSGAEELEDRRATVTDDGNGNLVLRLYYHYQEIDSIDDIETEITIAKSELPFADGVKISYSSAHRSIALEYRNGTLEVYNSYERPSQGQKYATRRIEWHYSLIATPDLANVSIENASYLNGAGKPRRQGHRCTIL